MTWVVLLQYITTVKIYKRVDSRSRCPLAAVPTMQLVPQHLSGVRHPSSVPSRAAGQRQNRAEQKEVREGGSAKENKSELLIYNVIRGCLLPEDRVVVGWRLESEDIVVLVCDKEEGHVAVENKTVKQYYYNIGINTS